MAVIRIEVVDFSKTFIFDLSYGESGLRWTWFDGCWRGPLILPDNMPAHYAMEEAQRQTIRNATRQGAGFDKEFLKRWGQRG